MNLDIPVSIISSIVGLISIGGVLYTIAYWKGKTDKTLTDVCSLPARTSSLETKMDILWALFVDNILEKRPNLAKRGSGYKLTDMSEECLKDIRHVIVQVKKEKPTLSPSDTLTIVAQRVGMLELQKIAEKNGCTLSEYFSILTIKLGVSI
jgi:hypothetical protein